MAKKELRRAARGPRNRTKAVGIRRPTWRRALIQGAILAVVYFILAEVVFKSKTNIPLYVNVFWTVIFFVMYTGFIYTWERFLYRRRLRDRQADRSKQ